MEPMEHMSAGSPCIVQKPANEDALIAAGGIKAVENLT
jgi:hypothetical protein